DAVAAGTTIGTPGDGKPDFIYNPVTGDLTFVCDGASLTTTGGAASFVSSISVSSTSGKVLIVPVGSTTPANVNPKFYNGSGVTLTSTLLASAITGTPGFTDGSGDGSFDIGNVLPPGLFGAALAADMADITVKYQVLNGGALKNADIVVPEPTSLAL